MSKKKEPKSPKKNIAEDTKEQFMKAIAKLTVKAGSNAIRSKLDVAPSPDPKPTNTPLMAKLNKLLQSVKVAQNLKPVFLKLL
jgi:hypothetical protein